MERLSRGSRPVVLGLGHSVSKVDVLGPSLLGVGSTLGVPLGVILEDSGLGDVLGVVVGLLLLLLLTDAVVLGGSQSGRNVGLSCFDLSKLQLLVLWSAEKRELVSHVGDKTIIL